MKNFNVTSLRNSGIWSIYRMRDRINYDPEYQRQGDVWNLEKRQLLIDTILNGFDVPKLYFHKYLKPIEFSGREYDYAIIDGKQRLTAIWDFIDGKFPLADGFEYFQDPNISASGFTYADLAKKLPDIKADFDSFLLAVICIETDEIEMIEEMFSRLNESEPLNAPEKRNAFSGPLPQIIRDLQEHDFFSRCLPFSNKRYKHLDIATKFLLFEEKNDIVNTKKTNLDDFVKGYSSVSRYEKLPIEQSTRELLDVMSKVFVDFDPLLKSIGMVVLYYHVFRQARNDGWLDEIQRERFVEFDRIRTANRSLAKEDLSHADYDLLEFDKLNQSPNDKSAISFRLKTILENAFDKKYSI